MLAIGCAAFPAATRKPYCGAQAHGLTAFKHDKIGRLHWPVRRGTKYADRLQADPAEPQENRMTTAANTHLVIADDHPLFRDALRQAVAASGVRRDRARPASFDDLTALLERESDVDLILLDLTMPGICGFSGLIYLRAQYPAIPVVIVSASDDAATIRRSLDFGASGFIPKRFGVDTLRAAILQVLEGMSGFRRTSTRRPPPIPKTGCATAW